jgi:outer membrane protein assembly factor BamB
MPTRCRPFCFRLTAALSLAALLALTVLALPARGADKAFTDPAPPAVSKLDPQPAAIAKDNPDATFHAAPKALARGAVTHDWTGFLGPSHNLVSTETKLLDRFPAGGPAVIWEAKRGTGYGAPAILGERVVLFHRVEDDEVVECLQAETGKRFWRFAYPTKYEDRYGYCNGPRASPVIGGSDDRRLVVTCGAEGKLHCLELATGRVVWARDLLKEFRLKQNFFGVGSTPLIEGDRLIVNVGAPGGPCVAAFDLATGRMLWGTGDQWGPSYASPIPATVYGKQRVFVFAGGETGFREKPAGGLLCIDPANGHVDFTFPWRGTRRESVNASSPLVFEREGRVNVLVSECYGSGGALLEVQPDFTAKTLWTNPTFGTHFMTAVYKEGHLYGVDGHGPEDAFLVCVDASNGKEVWRTQPEWKERVGGREMTIGTYRAQLMPVDGRCLCLGEFGHLLWIDLNPKGYRELGRAWLFAAGETWTPPVLSRGLLYVCQNTPDRAGGKGPRILCYDLRGRD